MPRKPRVLKRPVVVHVGWVRGDPAPWARHRSPTDYSGSWSAVVARGPRRALHVTHVAGAQDNAVAGLLARLRGMGYSGRARVVG